MKFRYFAFAVLFFGVLAVPFLGWALSVAPEPQGAITDDEVKATYEAYCKKTYGAAFVYNETTGFCQLQTAPTAIDVNSELVGGNGVSNFDNGPLVGITGELITPEAAENVTVSSNDTTKENDTDGDSGGSGSGGKRFLMCTFIPSAAPMSFPVTQFSMFALALLGLAASRCRH